MKFNFLLSTFKGYIVLKDFINFFGIDFVNKVYILKDPNILNDFSKEMILLCEKNNLKFDFNIDSLDRSHYTFAVGWRKIIKNPNNLYVIHDSILPKYLGFQPTVNSLINGEKFIGSTLFKAEEIFDQGPIVMSKRIKVNYPMKIDEAINRQADIASHLCIKFARRIIDGKKIQFLKNNVSSLTYSPWRDDKDYFIDWSKSASEIERFVNAVGYPYKGAQSKINGRLIYIEQVMEIRFKSVLQHNGKVAYLDKGCPVIICGKNAIKIISAKDELGTQLIPFKKLRLRLESL